MATTEPAATRTVDEVIARNPAHGGSITELVEVCEQLRATQAVAERLAARRVTLWGELRAAGVKIVDLAGVSGVSDPTIHQALKAAARRG